MKKNKWVIILLTIALLPATFICASDFAIVNFATCVSESKFGKQEQENLEYLRKQMTSMIQGTEKEIKALSAKFEDSEYLDSLSPKAEEELRMKYQTLNEDLARYQNQFYQVLNQANYQLLQKMNANIAKASEKLAKKKKLAYVINKEACFYYSPKLEITNDIISEMDKTFEKEQKNNQLSKAEEQPKANNPQQNKSNL